MMSSAAHGTGSPDIGSARCDDADRVLLVLVARGGVMITEPGESGVLVAEGGGSFAPEIARRLAGLLSASLLCAEADGRIHLTIEGATALRGR